MTKYRNYQLEAIDAALAGLPVDAPLRAIVRGEDVQAKLAAYEYADRKAVAEQTRFRFWGGVGLSATTFGVMVGALLLLPLDSWLSGQWRSVISGLQTLALVVMIGAAMLTGWLQPQQHWMLSRSAAERLRNEIFQSVLSGGAPAVNGIALSQQKLDLLMSAHLLDQLRFFQKRSREHERAAGDFTPLRLVGYLLIGCAIVLGVIASLYGLGVPLTDTLNSVGDGCQRAWGRGGVLGHGGPMGPVWNGCLHLA